MPFKSLHHADTGKNERASALRARNCRTPRWWHPTTASAAMSSAVAYAGQARSINLVRAGWISAGAGCTQRARPPPPVTTSRQITTAGATPLMASRGVGGRCRPHPSSPPFITGRLRAFFPTRYAPYEEANAQKEARAANLPAARRRPAPSSTFHFIITINKG
uniref:Uncharacterized protein n=1 Tax=Plectus sambesii TaxID=2011161 RepID=A0A914WZC3_9BILA